MAVYGYSSASIIGREWPLKTDIRLGRIIVIEVVALLLLSLGLTGPLASDALAGHTFGGGDCWRPTTPLMCRTNWPGRGTVLEKIRAIDQMGNGTLSADLGTAINNWTSAPGPQSFSTVATSGDSFNYYKLDQSIQAPNGYAWLCRPGACPSNVPLNEQWSEIYVTTGNTSTGLNVPIFAHESGHSLGLDHHPQGNSIMQQGTRLRGPTANDWGPVPPCQGAAGFLGTRCIYDSNT